MLPEIIGSFTFIRRMEHVVQKLKNGNTTLWNCIKIWLDKIKWSHFYYFVETIKCNLCKNTTVLNHRNFIKFAVIQYKHTVIAWINVNYAAIWIASYSLHFIHCGFIFSRLHCKSSGNLCGMHVSCGLDFMWKCWPMCIFTFESY
jgi:hypothetical protein